MPIKTITPYLFFNGTAQEAIGLYERALGAKLEVLQRYDELPEEGNPCPPAERKRVMHAQLRVGSHALMISDRATDKPRSATSNVHVALDFDGAAEQRSAFDALAEGGEVVMPLHEAFWGDLFAVVRDRFDIQWMLTSTHQAQ